MSTLSFLSAITHLLFYSSIGGNENRIADPASPNFFHMSFGNSFCLSVSHASDSGISRPSEAVSRQHSRLSAGKRCCAVLELRKPCNQAGEAYW